MRQEHPAEDTGGSALAARPRRRDNRMCPTTSGPGTRRRFAAAHAAIAPPPRPVAPPAVHTPAPVAHAPPPVVHAPPPVAHAAPPATVGRAPPPPAVHAPAPAAPGRPHPGH